MKKALLILHLLALLCLPASAWSDAEHRMMAYMAEEHLTANTKEFLAKYLDQSIVEYAVWMDTYRNSPGYEKTTKWHMVTVGEDGKSFPEGREGQAVKAVETAIDILSHYKEYNDSTVHINLIYLIHLIPEIHCPAHYYFLEFGDDKETKKYTFMPILWEGKTDTYHHMWDSSPTLSQPDANLDESKAYYDIWDDATRKLVSDGGPRAWFLDNARRIKKIYGWVRPNQALDRQFLLSKKDFIDMQVRLAAARLERTLNDLFDKWKETE
ncbi:MAG: S1/P1 nuclease [Bacteroidales bacterium]|nr:S1/P1 nuclease [Bacteroidales bacterium]